MLARIFTRLFYAAVFFALGVWAAPSMGGLGGMIDTGIAAGTRGFESLWAWADSTISTTAKPAAPVVVASSPAPAAARAPAAPPAPAPAPEKPKSPAVTAAPAPTPAPVSAPVADPLDVARAAHARGDVAGAIRAYDDLVAKRPTDAALRGELGNVYWAAGRLQDAAKSYHGAALALIAAGRRDEAARLEGAVRQGDAALADDLAKRLAEAARTK